MTLFQKIMDVFTGDELRKAHDDNTKASKELTDTLHKLSREERALDQISAMLEHGKQQNG